MKKLLFIALLCTTTATAAMAQTTPPAPSGVPSAQHEQKFEARKAEMVARIQQRLSCVQAASNGEALRACFPKREAAHEMAPVK